MLADTALRIYAFCTEKYICDLRFKREYEIFGRFLAAYSQPIMRQRLKENHIAVTIITIGIPLMNLKRLRRH
ncbi:MAG TPA: hypothetical protein VJ695_06935 [Nitrososphaera sp.]|nr:hypothetical protein [Nitrososphaera sp.]